MGVLYTVCGLPEVDVEVPIVLSSVLLEPLLSVARDDIGDLAPAFAGIVPLLEAVKDVPRRVATRKRANECSPVARFAQRHRPRLELISGVEQPSFATWSRIGV